METESAELAERIRQSLSRRSFVKHGLLFATATALPASLVACGADDAGVFAESTGTGTQVSTDTASSADPTAVPTTAPIESPKAQAEAAPTTIPEPTSAPEATSAPEPTEEPTTQPAGPIPLAIDFVYTMAAGGKQLDPYVAVWIENVDGVTLRTIELWFQQDSKGPKWLKDLTQWWRRDQARLAAGGSDLVDVVSSATRKPGAYSLLWDGLDDAGQPVLDETVVVCIESARERGPYSLICEQVTPAVLSTPLALPDDGELSGANLVRT